MKRSLNHPHHQRGAVLLLSVLILASLTAVAGGVAALLYTDLRSNRNVDEGIQAYYQAESGLESGLNVVRLNRNTGVCSSGATVNCQVDNDCTPPTRGACQFHKFSRTVTDDIPLVPLLGTASRVTATKTSRLAISQLLKDQSVQLNIFDPDNFVNDTGIHYISFTGTTTNNAWLEVTWSGWDINGTFFDQTTKELISGCGFDSNPISPIQPFCGSGGPQKISLRAPNQDLIAFQIRVKAILGDVSNITVDAYKSDVVTKISLPPSHITLKSTSAVGQAQTALSAVVPWRLPASGLFDFVLFSEETIKKE